jgi:formylglycine-generating enzyme
MDVDPVTNKDFAEFVGATGYVTLAEQAPSAADYPGANKALLVAGSSVFVPPDRPVDLDDPYRWQRWTPGANWRHPYGPGSSLAGLGQHPVVHVALGDALAYAAWAGKRLPTEAEWEFAARGALDGAEYAWGDELNPDGAWMANTWQGPFPLVNLARDGYQWTSPVDAFPPNGYGLHDMTGNVWEWTTTPWSPTRRVVKGGSHLCAPNHSARYRPAARAPQPVDASTSDLGFRCVTDTPPTEPGTLRASGGEHSHDRGLRRGPRRPRTGTVG